MPDIAEKESLKQISDRSLSRNRKAFEMREDGKTFREIGEFFDVSSSRAQQMTYKYFHLILKREKSSYFLECLESICRM